MTLLAEEQKNNNPLRHEMWSGHPDSHHLVIDGGSHEDDLFLSVPVILETMLAFLRGEGGLPASAETLGGVSA